jgi:acetylornithine deacetylase/succinyl-diaminopimelate desuccinylase-like protein
MALLNEGYQPRRTIMLAFGQDEESSGFVGAAQIAGGCHMLGLFRSGVRG